MSSATAFWLDYAHRMSVKRGDLTLVKTNLGHADHNVRWIIVRSAVDGWIFPLRSQCLIAEFFYRSGVHAAKNHVKLKHRVEGRRSARFEHIPYNGSLRLIIFIVPVDVDAGISHQVDG